MDSNGGLAHQHPQISLPIRQELPQGLEGVAAACNSLSTSSTNCSEKTRKKSAVRPSAAEIDSEADVEKCSLRHNTRSSLKRPRVPELHNKSEKRRRDKINEKMRTLQQLIPNSGKTDKSSILDEAIEYVKYLQFQIQYMWMQSGMDPRLLILFTGMQVPKVYYQPPYLQQMGMSRGLMGLDMAMGFGMSIRHPSSHMATMQTTIPGQWIPSSQLHPNSSFFNATNGYDGMQSSAVNTTYGTRFPYSENHQQ